MALLLHIARCLAVLAPTHWLLVVLSHCDNSPKHPTKFHMLTEAVLPLDNNNHKPNTDSCEEEPLYFLDKLPNAAHLLAL